MKKTGLTLLAAGAMLAVTGCEPGVKDTADLGFRGVGMQQVAIPGVVRDSLAAIERRAAGANVAGEAPESWEPAPEGTWENVQVLGHLSEAEFNRFMLAMTLWVAQGTGQGCNYCHVVEEDGNVNFALDNIYTKQVSRDMIRMTQDLNVNWSAHVGEAGVNCWTCHQGQALPTNYWFFTEGDQRRDIERYYVNEGARQTERYYLDQEGIRVISDEALRGDSDNRSSITDTRHLYWVMMEMSEALGVNCTYCHTSARFADWEESPPARVTALRGVRMVRALNTEYMVPLQSVWPENRLGALGDGPKIQCSTCHNGANQPQYGIPTSKGAGHPAITQIGFPHAGVSGSAMMMEMDGMGEAP
jgi:photosynthetic reaction center cytochrome c subunit